MHRICSMNQITTSLLRRKKIMCTNVDINTNLFQFFISSLFMSRKLRKQLLKRPISNFYTVLTFFFYPIWKVELLKNFFPVKLNKKNNLLAQLINIVFPVHFIVTQAQGGCIYCSVVYSMNTTNDICIFSSM